jgi:hypothetical protein
LTYAALLGGLFIGILSALPIVNIANCCCLWITGGGFIAALLTQQPGAPPLGTRRGALAGLLAGVVGACVWLVAASALDVIVAPLQDRLVAQVLQNADDYPPEVRRWLESVGNSASTPSRIAAGFVFQLFAGLVFAPAGGAIAGAWFRKPLPPSVPPHDVIPPPLPPPQH